MSAYPATCLLGHRLNAFRLAYLSPAIFINIGGIWNGTAQGVLVDSLAIGDRLNDVPNTLTATIRGARPVEGGAIGVKLGSINANPLFVGTMLRVTRVWGADNPAQVLYHVEATDPTWPLMGTLFSVRYRQQSASAIAADLLTRAPAGFSGVIQPDLPGLEEISFTNTTLVDAFVQLAKRIGGYTLVDYRSRIHLFTTDDNAAAPRALTPDHPSLAGVSVVRDLTQIVTRAIVEGGGVNSLAPVVPGSAVLPVGTVAWYAAGGGFVRSGAQRIRYTGLEAGGAGSLAGTGVTPTTAPIVAATAGSSAVELGAHAYAYTWVTGIGETLPSPLASTVLGAPAVPLAIELAPIGNVSSGLVIGVTYQYRYVWSYVDADRDVSQISAVSDVRSGVCEGWLRPFTITAPAVPGVGPEGTTAGAVDAGAHGYAYTFLTATGESVPSPVASVTLGPITPATTAPVWTSVKAGSAITPDPARGYVVGATARVGVTVGWALATAPGVPVSAISPASAPFLLAQAAGFSAGSIRVEQFTCPRTNDAQATQGKLYVSVWNAGAGQWDPWYPASIDYNNAGPGTVLVDLVNPGWSYPLPPAAPWTRVRLSGLTAGSGGVTGRRLYRTVAGGSQLRLLATIADTTSTTYIDAAPDSSLGANAPTVALETVPGGLTFQPYPGALDPAAQRILAFRLVAGAWLLVRALPVHAWTSGTYRDTIGDAALVADPVAYPPNPAINGNVVLGRAVVSGVSPGPADGAGVTARKIYRTKAGATALQFWTTLAGNTATTVPGYDDTPDAALGAAPPTTDTAGVIQQTKLVAAGSTELPLTSTAPFRDAGGFVLAGAQVIGYSGRSSTALTGVPGTGDNAILTSIPWGTAITAAPLLVGIPPAGAGAIVYKILRADPVNVVVIVDDAAAQAALAARLGGGDGVRESLLADGRIGIPEATARGRALLAANKDLRETVAYRSRDPLTRSGALIVVDLPAPTDVHGTYRIQDVGITRFQARGLVPPTYEVRASSQQFTFEDWLRQLARTQAPPATGE